MFQVAWCQPRGLKQVVGRETVCYKQSGFEERRSLRDEIITGVMGRHTGEHIHEQSVRKERKGKEVQYIQINR
jgi:hypothetical protein